MSSSQQQYCLDANVLIQAWQKYYSMKLCPSYWDFLDDLGNANKIFLPEHVREEIVRTEDDLYASPNRGPVVSRERCNFPYLTTAK
jgi:hypothetical protein